MPGTGKAAPKDKPQAKKIKNKGAVSMHKYEDQIPAVSDMGESRNALSHSTPDDIIALQKTLGNQALNPLLDNPNHTRKDPPNTLRDNRGLSQMKSLYYGEKINRETYGSAPLAAD